MRYMYHLTESLQPRQEVYTVRVAVQTLFLFLIWSSEMLHNVAKIQTKVGRKKDVFFLLLPLPSYTQLIPRES